MGKNQKIGDGMRWLYDDDESYAKAVRKMRIEAAMEARKKQLAQKTRVTHLKRAKVRMIDGTRTTAGRLADMSARAKKVALLSGVVLVVSVVAFTTLRQNDDAGSGKATTVQGVQDKKIPEFDYLIPKDAPQSVSGAVAYDSQRKVASFSDVIGADSIVVSQQPLPEKFKIDPVGELEKFAKQINANDKIEVGEVTAYSGVSIKGPQTIVLIKNGVLLFMTSDHKLQNKAWFDYIAKLQ